MRKTQLYDISLEIGKKKVFASAVDWPGWCRSGKDEGSAIEALLRYSQRYARILESTDLEFIIPKSAADFNIIERVKGNFTTDFGTPDMPIESDKNQVRIEDVNRFQSILKAAWHAFDEIVRSAKGKELRKGSRGGGRDLEQIINHVVGAEGGYLRSLGWTFKLADELDVMERRDLLREEIIKGIYAAAEGQMPAEGPRGGRRWPLPYFVRRAAWHVIDHAWEIEDRIV